MNIAAQTDNVQYTPVTLDMSAASWVDANMCAPLGAVLHRASHNLNPIGFVKFPPAVQNILQKNGFLSYYGHAKKPDDYGTTIQYNRFERKDDRYFGAYIERHFKNKAIPEMSAALRKKFWESIFELFSNAVIHSETRMGIFTCGQYFPAKNRIDFAIADLGIGIPKNLADKKGLQLPAQDAINWAMEGRNTTKTGPIPGGLGLKLLREFIRLNQGRIQVVSDAGYWEQRADGIVDKRTLPHPFPGTVVNIEINTADVNSYVLSSELQHHNIF
ncbi:MAG: ATP-binding protein [Anaerolineales bacterium]